MFANPCAVGGSCDVITLWYQVRDVTSPGRRYAHRWEKGDFVIWDSRLTLHSASAEHSCP